MTNEKKIKNIWQWFRRVIYWLCGACNKHENPN